RFMGNGDGTFQPGADFSAFNPVHVVVADMDADGILDLVAAGGSGISLVRGNGNGTFQAPRIFAVDAFTTHLAVADFQGDGRLDVVVTKENDALSVLLGNGDMTLRAAVNYPAGPGPGAGASAVAVGDFNGDGGPDLAVALRRFDNVAVLLNRPDAVRFEV